MSNFLRNIFNRSEAVKNDLPFSKKALHDTIQMNRQSLKLIDTWIDDEAFKNSWFNYGVPDYIKDKINKPINDDITYTDLMLFLSKNFFEKLNYLEIGVSVGKNFFQVLNAPGDARLTCFDIEEINPIIERKLTFNHIVEWETPANSIKKSKSSLKTYTFNRSEVKYLCADVWDENSWSKLKDSRFNLVFSDALHTPEAILFEFEMLFKYNLLDEKFVIVWDDLVGKMKNSFYKIIRKYNKVYKLQDIYLLSINGWVGEHESPHSVGIISNFALKDESSTH